MRRLRESVWGQGIGSWHALRWISRGVLGAAKGRPASERRRLPASQTPRTIRTKTARPVQRSGSPEPIKHHTRNTRTMTKTHPMPPFMQDQRDPSLLTQSTRKPRRRKHHRTSFRLRKPQDSMIQKPRNIGRDITLGHADDHHVALTHRRLHPQAPQLRQDPLRTKTTIPPIKHFVRQTSRR